MSLKLLKGDCLETLKTLPDSSIDSVVTDPPYELSNDGKASSTRVAAEIMFPKNAKLPAGVGDDSELLLLLGKIAGLGVGGGIPGEPAPVPVGSVTLNDEPTGGDDDVTDPDEPTVGTPNAGTRDNGDSQLSEYAGCFYFKLAHVESAVHPLNSAGTGFVSGGIGVGLGVSPSSLPSFVSSCGPVPLGDDVVGAFDNALSCLVGAGLGAEVLTVPDPIVLGGGTENVTTAGGALVLLGLGVASGAELVRAGAGTGGLPSKLQATRICIVDDSTNRTLSFDIVTHTLDCAGVGFMGKQWDGSKIAYNVKLWAECLRVLKPGGHVLAFGATRTYHRMAVAIEDAGFEIRDSLHWSYGSGFPKSLSVGKAIDKQKANRDEILQFADWLAPHVKKVGVKVVAEHMGVTPTQVSQHWCSHSQTTVPTLEQIPRLLDVLGVDEMPEDIQALALKLNKDKKQPGPNWFKREKVGTSNGTLLAVAPGEGRERPPVEMDITAPATEAAAKQWEGWGTALKPSHEPIVVARKPLSGTVAQNIQEWGTGGLNIDGSRIGSEGGRWPANTLLTHNWDCEPCTPGCPVATLDEQAEASRFYAQLNWSEQDKIIYIPKPSKRERNAGLDGMPEKGKVFNGQSATPAGKASGSVEDKFSTAPSANNHPTVKPVRLMEYLIKLITPPGGTVLDPFLGSGTTAVAATNLGYNTIVCELTPEYYPIIKARVAHAEKQKKEAEEKQAKATQQDKLPL